MHSTTVHIIDFVYKHWFLRPVWKRL